MMKTSELVQYLKQQFPGTKVYNGTINKLDSQCIGVYPRGNVPPILAIGGIQNTSWGTIPISILVHWSENSDTCETMANSLYKLLFENTNFTIGTRRIVQCVMMDSYPVDVGRTDSNICERVIRCTIQYEREVE